MSNYRLLNIVLPIFIGVIFTTCIEDNVVITEASGSTVTEKILQQIEANDNYITSDDFPALVSAEDLQANSQLYTIIDVRDQNEFLSGHIPGSVNISNVQLFDYVTERRNSNIVLVSLTGQEASYYTALFRIYGIENVYALKFGFAVWNNDFSSIWLETAKNLSQSGGTDNAEHQKNNRTNLPTLLDEETDKSVSTIFQERIKFLITQGFNDNDLELATNNTVSFQNLFLVPEKYIICSGENSLYFMEGNGHIAESILYISLPTIQSNLKSISFLQTLPTDKPILIYSYSGQISAMFSGYLSTIGYDARSILFGNHNIFYSLMDSVIDREFQFLVFKESEIKNFDYDGE